MKMTKNIAISALGAGILLSAPFSTTSHATPMQIEEVVNSTTTYTGALVLDGLQDAFDGAFFLNSGLAGLDVIRQIDTLESIQTYRLLDTFTNNTASTITTTIGYFTDLGSDGDELIVEEGAFRSITFQERDDLDGTPVGEVDPVLAFTFGNNSFTTNNAVGDVLPGEFELTFDVSILAGESLSLLQFATLIKDDTDRSGDVALATARSDALIALPDLSGLSVGLNDIANFGAVSTVPVPAALPLFGTGLAFMGFLGWRRKRKSA